MAFWSRKKPVDPAQAKLAYLAQYTRGDYELLSPYPGDIAGIPDSWDRLLGLPRAERVEAVLALWDGVVAQAMSNTIAYLHTHLRDVDLLRVQDQYLLLYTIASTGSDDTAYYAGGNPLTPNFAANTRLADDWARAPERLRAFYAELHNGFYHYSSESAGPLPLSGVCAMNSIEWGILETLDAPVAFDLESSYAFFSNGGGGYVVIDLANADADKATLFWTDEPPVYDQKFWDLVDEWTVIGFG
ncbi:MAG: hypothetical protein QM713_05575 [Arachnia sp.]